MLDLIAQDGDRVTFQEHVADRFPRAAERIALLVSSEYEGYYKNGGIGTYYTALSQRLTADGWYVILLLCATEAQYQGKSKTPALQQVYSVSEVRGLLNLNAITGALLDEANLDIYDHQSFCILFFTQALLAQCQHALVYAEFPEMCGFGYRTMQAKQAGLLERCITAVTVHSGHEWVYEANQKFTVPYPNYFWQTCHYEQDSFEKADLSFHPSNFIRAKVESYGWQADHAIRLPYFVPQIKDALPSNPALPSALNRLDGGKIPIVFFARLEERKGLCTFVQALQQLAPELSQHCHLFFLGKVVSLFSYDLKHLDSQQYLEQELGGIYAYDIYANLYSEQALDLIRHLKSAIVCLTSPQDNFPNSALEMGQLPVSIIAANTGGFRETLGLLERSDGVHWFTPGDSVSLIACFQKVLSLFPECPTVPSAAFLEQLNHKLLDQRKAYISQVKRHPSSVQPNITVSVFCSDDDMGLIDCLQFLHQQTLKPSQVFVLDGSTVPSTQKLLVDAREQFSQCQFLSWNAPPQGDAIANWLQGIQTSDYTLLLSASDRPAATMLEKLGVAITHAGGSIACSPSMTGTTAPRVNSYRTGFLPQLLFTPPPRMPLLVTPDLLASLKLGSNVSLDSLTAQLLVDTAGRGRQLIYFPYPLHWTSKPTQFANPEVWLQACFKVREYLAEIPPSAWNSRQIYMLMAGIQHLSLPTYTPTTSDVNVTVEGTSFDGNGFKSLAAYDVKTLLKASAWKLAKRSYSSIAQYESLAPVAQLRRRLVRFFTDNSR